MTDRALHRLGWAAFAAAALVIAAGVALGWATRHVAHSEGFSGGGPAGFVLDVLISTVFLLYPLVGIVIVRRRPRNPIGWLLIATGASWGLVAASIAYGDWALKVHRGAVAGGAEVASVSLWAWAPAVAITGVFLLLVFPNGHLPGPRWRWLVYVCGAAVIASIGVDVVNPGPMSTVGFPGHDNPFGLAALEPVTSALEPVVILIPLSTLAAIASVVVRYRRAGLTERLQITWLAASGALCGVSYGVILVLGAAFTQADEPTPGWLDAAQGVWFVSLGLIPVAIGIAVMRYRLFEIDVIIRRTLTYALVAAAIAAIYLVGVTAVSSAVQNASGQSSALAVTVSTLLAVVAFRPLQTRVKRAVDHRFSRATYDTAVTLEQFGATLRNQIDLDSLEHEMLGVVGSTVKPVHANLWLRSHE